MHKIILSSALLRQTLHFKKYLLISVVNNMLNMISDILSVITFSERSLAVRLINDTLNFTKWSKINGFCTEAKKKKAISIWIKKQLL